LRQLATAPRPHLAHDIGAAAEVILHDENAPCVVFQDVPGTLAGSRVVVNFFGGRRQKMTLGFPLHLSKLELSEAFREHYLADLKRIPPRYVNDGPVFENVITGDAVDVTMFPTPKWHPEDGGRYIGTGSFNVTRDPDEGWINCGTYRVMIHDDKTVGFYPWHWRDKFPKVNAPSREAARLARQRFGYLLK
jgi:UbiD family decarboxylase